MTARKMLLLLPAVLAAGCLESPRARTNPDDVGPPAGDSGAEPTGDARRLGDTVMSGDQGRGERTIPAEDSFVPTSNTPFGMNGRLNVCGNRMCNSAGKELQLRGMSTHGLQWYGWGGDNCLNEGSLDALADEWGADVLRISSYPNEGGYNTDPTFYTDMVDTLVDEALERGLYALIDWHMLQPGDPLDPSYEGAGDFFDHMSSTHGGKGHVIYELCNEPSGVSWSQIKTYAEGIIPIIRGNDPDGIIIVGTREWSSFGISGGADPDEVIANPVTGDNIMYALHFYAASHGESYRVPILAAADQIPIFVTEWGTPTYTGDGGNDIPGSQAWIDLMRTKKISWTFWNYCDDFRSSSVFETGTCPGGPWVGASLKDSGQAVFSWMQDPPDDF